VHSAWSGHRFHLTLAGLPSFYTEAPAVFLILTLAIPPLCCAFTQCRRVVAAPPRPPKPNWSPQVPKRPSRALSFFSRPFAFHFSRTLTSARAPNPPDGIMDFFGFRLGDVTDSVSRIGLLGFALFSVQVNLTHFFSVFLARGTVRPFFFLQCFAVGVPTLFDFGRLRDSFPPGWLLF